MSQEIDDLKAAAGAYSKEALEARKKFIELRHRQDIEIRNLLIRTADQVAAKVRSLSASSSSPLQISQQQQIEKGLRREAEKLNGSLTKALQGYITEAVEGGAGFSQAVTVNLLKDADIDLKVDELFYRVNRRAVEACWNRTQKGLKLSDRIWQKGETFEANIQEIIRQSVALGQDAVVTSRMLEQYIRQDTKTLAKDYPHMMEHLQGRVPEDLSYEALRLVRTETTAAFGDATVAGAQAAPSYKGLKWVLSKSHPVRDICDELAAHDEGLGIGVYAPGNEPYYPAHPNDMCFLVPVHEQPEEFVQRLKRWRNDPVSEPQLENWYQKTYSASTDEKTLGLETKNLSPHFDDRNDRKLIESDLALLPSKHLELLKQEGISLLTGSEQVSGFYANENAIKLLQNIEPGEVIHEVGHFLEKHFDLFNNAEFLQILENGLSLPNITEDDLKINLLFEKSFIQLKREDITKFISELQARIYFPNDGNDFFIQSGDAKIFNIILLREYFAEGYREFFDDPQRLKEKDILLYQYIERLVK